MVNESLNRLAPRPIERCLAEAKRAAGLDHCAASDDRPEKLSAGCISFVVGEPSAGLTSGRLTDMDKVLKP